ncbi:MAG: TniB family NTP-binding protein [Campylobacterales bacterium]|uniref:TniB family NTP-binding protein n=1 Tax=Sulfurimonas sp. TaxID=2022749 RepID=UPI0019B03D48|nr:TniB family NTP-binding protein [Sulfurimonas sp.]MBD3797197.1 TniB family NTP-binding protein [Campylobacterales bacterium]MBD3823303.1 TniB family NTP-binding protein [Campylobacterota bacterium]MBD3841590.1 TniB family NTP-binding protein [Campylobacterales bacterium]MDD2653246.1 TniB family NTP-binding protein [Sulfurimonas sp.]MDD3452291.1 TniB family NTP-binding protein [Sulfurimonas sp.]
MPETYAHLLPESKEVVIHKNTEERIEYLENKVWINYPLAQKVILYLNDLLKYPKQDKMPGLLIVGEPNIGKSAIVSQFAKLHPDKTLEDDTGMSKAMKTVVVANMEGGDDRTLYISILEQLWTPFRPTDTTQKLRHQTIHLLRELNVKMLILDEIHNLLKGTAIKQRAVMDAIKNLTNSLKIPIVLVGIMDAVTVLNEAQHVSRFEIVQLPKWSNDKEFAGLLAAFERWLPLKKPSGLYKAEMKKLLYEHSNGNLGHLRRILITCAKYAIQNDVEQITPWIIKNVPTKNSKNPMERIVNLDVLYGDTST